MFRDKFGLTQAVLDGHKTMTRRIITCPIEFKGEWVAGFYVYTRKSDNAIIQWPCMYDEDERNFDGGEILPKYKVGEIVAIAQSYKDAGYEPGRNIPQKEHGGLQARADSLAGWNNKLFTRADLMPHHIRITDVRVEGLQDISDEDCIKEGIYKGQCGSADTHFMDAYYYKGDIQPYCTPREAFAALIDKVSGNGTWNSNPWVFAYEFELVD